MNRKFTVEEAFVEKRFKKDGFKVVKLDVSNKYKASDFKITKGNLSVLVEVKIGFKKGRILETLSTGASKVDPSTAVEDYFRNASLKYRDYILHNPKDSRLPFILLFITPFYIDKDLEWSDHVYKNYKIISAVFIAHRIHPLDDKANEMTTEQLEKIITSDKIPFSFQTKLVWKIIKNPYANRSLKDREFLFIKTLKWPISDN
jgi:hypothetical protein